MECNDHGGHGFKSDCWICKAKQTLKDNEGAIERRDKVIAAHAATIEALEAEVKLQSDSADNWEEEAVMWMGRCGEQTAERDALVEAARLRVANNHDSYCPAFKYLFAAEIGECVCGHDALAALIGESE